VKYAEKELVSLKRDPTSVGVVLSVTPGPDWAGRYHAAGVLSDNHYQVYWSAGTNVGVDIDETWHTEEELTQAKRK